MSTTMDQIHHIRDMFYQQDKNISEIASETGLNWKTVKNMWIWRTSIVRHPYQHHQRFMNPNWTRSNL